MSGIILVGSDAWRPASRMLGLAEGLTGSSSIVCRTPRRRAMMWGVKEGGRVGGSEANSLARGSVRLKRQLCEAIDGYILLTCSKIFD